MASTKSLDQQLRSQLLEYPEIVEAGFSVREGLTGAGVTLLRGRTYFGSWRSSSGSLAWVSANMGDATRFVDSTEAAVRHTLLMILRALESSRGSDGTRIAT